MTWTQAVNPNYLFIAPELILVATTLVVMIADLYTKEKRTLVWVTFGGVLLSLAAVFYTATDEQFTKAMAQGSPLEFFGNAVVADGFTFFMKGILLSILALVILLSVDYVEKFLRGMYMEFYQIVMAVTLGMLFMVSSRDLLTIYIGLELASISSYVLAGLLRKDPKSNEAALKYFLNGAMASAILLFGLSIIYGVTGTTYLPEIGNAMRHYASIASTEAGLFAMIAAGVIFLVIGFAFKVAAAPMHLWAPDVYEGSPTPVTGFFSVGPKGAAFAAILRIFLVGLGVAEFAERWTMAFAILAVVSMFIGNITALLQSNVKRMMAYSSIAQAGYVLVGVVAAGSNLESGFGSGAVLFYVLGYAFTNIGIFAILTHMDREGGWVNVSDFNGLAQRNPMYAWALLLFFISLIGLPPTVGFFGKFYLFRAALDTGYLWLALAMAVNSAISVAYYYGVVKAMFLEKSDKQPLQTNGGALTAVAISFAGVLLVGIFSGWFISYATDAALALVR